jgi:hypothetical protein
MYESAACAHGRRRVLKGRYYASAFAHYQPVDASVWNYTIAVSGAVGVLVHCACHRLEISYSLYSNAFCTGKARYVHLLLWGQHNICYSCHGGVTVGSISLVTSVGCDRARAEALGPQPDRGKGFALRRTGTQGRRVSTVRCAVWGCGLCACCWPGVAARCGAF